MKGPYALRDPVIDRVVESQEEDSPSEVTGVFLLGHKSKSGTFIPDRMVRADHHLNQALHQWVGKWRYRYFKFERTPTSLEAFKLQCNLHHDTHDGDPDHCDGHHPKPPKGKNWICPCCTIFERA